MSTSRPWRAGAASFGDDMRDVTRWLERHREGAHTQRVWSECAPGDVLDALPTTVPTAPVSVTTALDDIDRWIVPGLVRWDAPGWFAWFPSNAQEHALLGDVLGAAMAQQGMLWISSPACTEVEIRMLEWLRQAMGLPDRFAEGGPGGGVIQDTASSAVLSCLVAARDRATDGLARDQGLHAAGPLTVYASDQTHSSVLKAASIAGIGRANVRAVQSTADGAMDVAALSDTIRADIESGCRPIFCCATVGSTASGAIDPVDTIATVCDDHSIWLHVDAAWAGTAALSARWRDVIIAGADLADSWCFNPHKWMGVNFDCSCLWVADRVPLIDAMSVTPEYLRNDPTDSGGVVDYRDWHVQLGRRFRALKLWMVLRCTGTQALADMVDHHVGLASHLADEVNASTTWTLAAPVSLGLVCIRHVDGDDATQAGIDAVNADGRFAVTHCKLHDQLVLRVAIGSLDVERSHIDALWGVLQG